jgi:hypothetical protein
MRSSSRLLTVFLAAAVSVLAVRMEAADAVNHSVPVLTADDYAQIEQLYVRYGPAYDTALDHGNAWANLFTPDGLHINETNHENITGREALAMFAYQILRVNPTVSIDRTPTTKNEKRIGHHIINLMLEPVPGGVNSIVYWLGVNIDANGNATMNPSGVDFDFIVKTAEGWRFKHKNVNALGVPLPDSLAPSFKAAFAGTH